jgi:hypothetical protein
MKTNYLLWLAVAGLILLGIWYWTNQSRITPTVTPGTETEVMLEETPEAAEPIEITLEEQNDLGQSGAATLSEDADGMLVVTLALVGGTLASPQPAHIHEGACPKPGAVVYPLNSVVNGKSTTTLDISWEDFMATTDPMAVNVHKSVAEASVYTACGDIPVKLDGAMMEDETAPTETDTGDDAMQY